MSWQPDRRDFSFSVPVGSKEQVDCVAQGVKHWFATNKMARDRCIRCGGKRCETCGGGGVVPEVHDYSGVLFLECAFCQARGVIDA